MKKEKWGEEALEPILALGFNPVCLALRGRDHLATPCRKGKG